MKERIDWLDVAKGIGIFLVVLGHNSITPGFFGWIYSFHMPLFFYLSGFLFSADKYNSTLDFIKRKAQTLLLPYLSFFVLIYIYWLLAIQKVWLNPVGSLQPILDFFYGSTHLKTIFTPLWFLPALFLVEVIFYLIYKKTKKWLVYTSVLVAILGLSLNNVSLPWNIGTAMVAILFFMVGFKSKDTMTNLQTTGRKTFVFPLALIFLIINLLFFKLNSLVDLLPNHYGNFVWFILSALGGIGAVIAISFLLSQKKNKLIDSIIFIGRNSLIIFAFHPIGIILAKMIVGSVSKIGNWPIHDDKSLFFGILYSLIAILLVLPLIFVLNRYLPFLLGKKIVKD